MRCGDIRDCYPGGKYANMATIVVQAMKRGGFTLIELVVVIAIIMTIMALLMPALLTVRSKALAAQCQSNLHQYPYNINFYTL